MLAKHLLFRFQVTTLLLQLQYRMRSQKLAFIIGNKVFLSVDYDGDLIQSEIERVDDKLVDVEEFFQFTEWHSHKAPPCSVPLRQHQ
ncbi:hypothetical protein THOA03_180115 [Vibrio owensii]|nr:hypothetical protein THOA03_180115 [Vibrio owensii]